jgi:endoglucanase
MGLKKYFYTGICSICLVLLSSCWSQANSSQIDFSKGLNLAHWFFLPIVADEKMETSAYLQKWMTVDEVRSIAKAGFNHVRLPIDPDFLQPNWSKGDLKIQDDRLQAIDRAIELIEAEKLGVILDLHPTRRLKLEAQPYGADYQNIESIWKTLSDRYRKNSQMIAYEILNEPLVENPALWRDIAERLVALIRQVDPLHTVIVPAHGYSGVGELLDFRPVSGDRLLYTFHFYAPLVFTHQGATWLENYASLKNIPYPLDVSKPEKIPSNGRSQVAPETQKLWEEYKTSPANRSQLETQIKKVVQWRDRYKVSLYCGEYGVHGVAPKGDRYRWHQDVAEILQAENIGHSLWSYRAAFGLVTDGQTSMDQQLLRAIGLGDLKIGNSKLNDSKLSDSKLSDSKLSDSKPSDSKLEDLKTL